MDFLMKRNQYYLVFIFSCIIKALYSRIVEKMKNFDIVCFFLIGKIVSLLHYRCMTVSSTPYISMFGSKSNIDIEIQLPYKINATDVPVHIFVVFFWLIGMVWKRVQIFKKIPSNILPKLILPLLGLFWIDGNCIQVFIIHTTQCIENKHFPWHSINTGLFIQRPYSSSIISNVSSYS